MRLLLSPWGRLGGVIPFGEGAGVRLLLPLGEAGRGFQINARLLVNLSTRQLEPTLSLCFSNA